MKFPNLEKMPYFTEPDIAGGRIPTIIKPTTDLPPIIFYGSLAIRQLVLIFK